MQKWRAGIYLRLSNDDGDNKESNSISNQKNLIKYALSEKKEFKIIDYYVDDGFTGTDFNRPGFNKMMEDIYNGKINSVIVKDLSRLGRNYLEVGDFFERIVPQYDIRFIALNDNVDSYLKPESMYSLEIIFKNLMNESYAKDISNKVKSSLLISKKNGNFIGVVAPYGYMKDPEDKHKFIIDEEAAQVVKSIFDMAMKGKTRKDIIDELNKKNIITPSKYIKLKYNYRTGNVAETWSLAILDSILRNETYIGTLVQGKTARKSHKDHTDYRIDKEEWLKTKNHHKAIIKEDIFYQVNTILFDRGLRSSNSGKYYKYSGFLKCGDCNNNMYRTNKRYKEVDNIYYYCGNYLNNKVCSKHCIREDELDEVVLQLLNKFIQLVCDLEDKLKKELSTFSIEYNNEVKEIKLIKIEKEIKQYKDMLDEIKDDYKNELINDEDFDNFNEYYLYELNRLNLEKEAIENDKVSKNSLNWMNRILKLGYIDELNRNIVKEFINNIYVYNDKKIKIDFRFSNQYEEAIMYLKKRDNMV